MRPFLSIDYEAGNYELIDDNGFSFDPGEYIFNWSEDEGEDW